MDNRRPLGSRRPAAPAECAFSCLCQPCLSANGNGPVVAEIGVGGGRVAAKVRQSGRKHEFAKPPMLMPMP
eukprot:37382-Eustigmatos_ZCMA.PRE.1